MTLGPNRPGDGLLDPVVAIAVAVLVLNDHVAKAIWPGPVTGIASDVAGLIVAPLVLQAAWEIASWAVGRWRGPSMRALAVTIVVVGVGFAAVQLWPPATDGYRWGLAALQWPVRAIAAIIDSAAVPEVRPVRAVADAADLLALPALAITWWRGLRRRAHSG